MTATVIVALGLMGFALSLLHDTAEAARQESVKANGRLGTALGLLRDADADSQELLEGQRTLAEQLEAAGIAPAIEVPPRRPRRSASPVRPVSPQRTGPRRPPAPLPVPPPRARRLRVRALL